ncbi:MAG: alcohol dehydrogenase catalytic domain-containing protein [Spirochaetes bacterium]|nr:alcohol dehydrogenase catalytic domain-containing protein [Spirochaetota bacterium]
MKACVLNKPYDVGMAEMKTPTPGPREVLVRVKATGLCGSDLHAYRGTHKFRIPPIISGHELAGVVEKIGDDVRLLKEGDRVTVEPWTHCGRCEFCIAGRSNLCTDKVAMGTADWSGSFAEYVTAPEEVTYLLPENVPFEAGALIEPLAASMHAVRRAGTRPGERAVVFGAGAIGLSILLLLKACGIVGCIVTDIEDFKLQLAESLGADRTVNTSTGDLSEEISDFTGGRGADVAFVAAGAGRLLQDATLSLKRGGRIAVPAIFDGPLSVDMFPPVFGEHDILGSWSYTKKDFDIVIDLLSSGTVDPLPLVTHRLPLNEAKRAFSIADKRSENAVKMLFLP